MSLIVGIDDFGKIIEKKLGFVDKSLFIKDIFDNEAVDIVVIVRPRRFGKTLNMSMLQHFLAAEVNGMKTQGIFDNLKIAQHGNTYMQHQGKYPVISISLKALKLDSYEKTYGAFTNLISKLYAEHSELLNGDTLKSHEKNIFNNILNETASLQNITFSLLNLSEYLHRYHKVKPWILIDEYDTPIQTGYLRDHYKEIIELMRGFLGSALKSNPHIHRGILTGILRISKESLFSDLNNVKVYSLLDAAYAEYFGFSQEEVDIVIKENNLSHLSDDIKTWYNGYHIGNRQIYNPWSIANCINNKGLLKPYWLNTSDNTLIKQIIAHADAPIKIQLEAILQGQPIEVLVDENITFADLERDSNRLWSLLLFAGYLTPIKNELFGSKNKCLLIPPNKEVNFLYHDIIVDWFAETLDSAKYQGLLETLTQGQLDIFLKILKNFLMDSASYFDVSGKQPEKFYHGLVMGLIISLSETHFIRSNRDQSVWNGLGPRSDPEGMKTMEGFQQSGYGRYDVLLIPKDKTKLGLILEFKVADSDEDIQAMAEDALRQINARQYESELYQQGIEKILKIGLAFRGKEVAMASE